MVSIRNLLGALIALKLAYLVVELAFNGQLVLTLSRGAAARDVHAIEFYGRIFSGLAAGLLMLRFAVQSRERRGSPGIGIGRIVLLLLLPAVFVFFAQKALVNWAAAQSDPATRQSAQRMTLLAAALSASDKVPEVQGFDPAGLTGPEATTLRALLGSSLYFSPKSLRFAVDRQEALIAAAAGGDQSRDLCRRYAQAGAQFTELYNNVYREANVQLSRALVPRAGAASPSAGRRQPDSHPRLMTPQERWDLSNEQFYKMLQTVFHSGPDRLLAHNYRRTSEMMFGRLVEPTEFCEGEASLDRPPKCPGSRAFVDAKVSEMRRGPPTPAASGSRPGASPVEAAARTRFDEIMQRSPIGAAVPPGLTIDQFERQPAVQRYLAGQMKAFGHVPSGTLSMGWSCKTVAAKVFTPQLRARGNARQASFADGAVHARDGRDAVRTLLTPIMSLGLSLFFGLLNVAGLFVLLALKILPAAGAGQAGFLRRNWTTLANAAILALVLALPFAAPAGLSRHPGYEPLMSSPATQPAVAVLKPVVDWILRVQPEMLPVTRAAAGVVFPERLHIDETSYGHLRDIDRAVIGWLPGGEDMHAEGE